MQNRKDCKCLKKCTEDDLDEALLNWVKVQCTAGLPVRGPFLKVQAEEISEQFSYSGFIILIGWLYPFKNRRDKFWKNLW